MSWPVIIKQIVGKRWIWITLTVIALIALVAGLAAAVWWPSNARPTGSTPETGTTSSTTTTTTDTTTESTTDTTTESTTTTTESTTTTAPAFVPPAPDTSGVLKYAALTFDDGPGPYTETLLNILAENNVKATFFIVGNRAGAYSAVIQRMAAEGHEVAGHSYSHARLPSLSEASIAAEINDTVSVLSSITGQPITVFRAPYGAVDDRVKRQAAAANLRLIHWSVDTLDWEVKKEDIYYARYRILNQIFNGYYSISDGGIVLMHDIHENSVGSVQMVIQHLREQGYELVTVSELLNMRAAGGVPGEVYREIPPQ